MTIGDGEEKFKFWYSGNRVGPNGVGIFVKQNLAENVIEVNRCSDRIIKIKLVLGLFPENPTYYVHFLESFQLLKF